MNRTNEQFAKDMKKYSKKELIEKMVTCEVSCLN